MNVVKRMVSRPLLLLLFTAAALTLSAQPFATGLNFDDGAYESLPITPRLMTRDFAALPARVSLKPYAPTPGSQGNTGTCTAWATARHARTIMESVWLGRTDRAETDRSVFSVSYVYNQIRGRQTCQEGTWIWDALELMHQKGVPRDAEFGFDCERQPLEGDHLRAREHRIEGYKRLHSTEDYDKIGPIKKCLAANKPVVFCMHLPPSFYDAQTVWQPADFEQRDPLAFGGHAMVIVGYDDSKYEGGAFEVMNSWGKDRWGDGGFTWVRYSDYRIFARYAFELIEGQKPGMNEVVLTAPDLGGEFQLELANGGTMGLSYDSQRGIYRSTQGHRSGTRFRLIIANQQPAYVYAFGSDQTTQQSFPVFPHAPLISPYLGYADSHVAIPDEQHYVEMDQTRGRDYFCILYSKKPLDIERIMQQMRGHGGNVQQKLYQILGTDAVRSSDIRFEQGTMRFSAFSKGASVLPVVVEIEHL
ncbi:MAG: hypothetical protein OHK0039_16910 [Bacteroidia bacterium]